MFLLGENVTLITPKYHGKKKTLLFFAFYSLSNLFPYTPAMDRNGAKPDVGSMENRPRLIWNSLKST